MLKSVLLKNMMIAAGAIFSVGSLATAEIRVEKPKEFAGKIAAFSLNRAGDIDGIVLDRKSSEARVFINLPPASLKNQNILPAKGEKVSAAGYVLAETPNVVVDPSRLKIGKESFKPEAFGSRTQRPPQEKPQEESERVNAGEAQANDVTGMLPIQITASLVAVSTDPSGIVNRVVLSDGSTSQLPRGVTLDPQFVKLNATYSVAGVAKKFDRGLFIHTTSFKNKDDKDLLVPKLSNGETWIKKQGTFEQALINPQGEVDGILLADGTSVRFAPLPPDSISFLKKGDPLEIAGLGNISNFRAESLIRSTDNQVLSLDQSSRPLPPNARTLARLSDTGEIDHLLKNPKGEIDAILLKDGTNVRLSPQVRDLLATDLEPGRKVAVNGLGGKYPLGTAIEAESVKVLK